MTETAVTLARSSLSTHGKSFSFASLALGQELRDEIAVLYAYCRRADDAVDLCRPRRRRAATARLEAELEAIYAGEVLEDPVLAAFQRLVLCYGIPRRYPEELLAGMRMDAEETQYETLPELHLYCYRVAGTVGLMMCHVLGVSDAGALANAAHLGMAMQLTNICRDIREDWERGRLYVPRELLGRDDANRLGAPGEPLSAAAREVLARATVELLRHADGLYRSGEQGIRFLPLRSAIAVRVARLVYADIGRVILSSGADPLAPRAFVRRRRKLALAVRAVLRSITESRPPFERVEIGFVLGGSDVVPV